MICLHERIINCNVTTSVAEQFLDQVRPDLFKIGVSVGFIINDNIISNGFGAVGEAGRIICAVIDVPRPAVRLDADRDVNPCHTERTREVSFVINVIELLCGHT